jgi:thiamine pyrophosphokinase
VSSHHIVKDNQEPALIIANGAACNDELLGQLLEWSPVVIALDGAIDRLLAKRIKVDVVLGDFDSVKQSIIADNQTDLTFISAPDQNKTDLEKAFDFLISKGHSAANVIWATGRRADHSFCNLSLLAPYRESLKITIYDDYSRVILLPRKFEKWYPKDTALSLVPLGIVFGIRTANLLYSLDNENLTLGYRNGNSNSVLEDGIVKIEHESGDLLLMECWD